MSRLLARVFLLVVMAAAGAHAPRAAKLAVFHNGRMLQVQDVRQEEGWYYLTLGKSSRIGVPVRLIAEIRDTTSDSGPSLPNVQASAGGSGGGQVVPANRAPVARPTRPASSGGEQDVTAGALTQEEARNRAEALAQRGRMIGRDLESLRQGANAAERDDRQQNAPRGIDLSGTDNTWPSPFRQEPRARGGRRDEPPPTDSTGEGEEDDN